MAKICRRTGKANYPSEKAARAALARVHRDGVSVTRRYTKIEIDVYKCLFCPYWHLTSQQQYGRPTGGGSNAAGR